MSKPIDWSLYLSPGSAPSFRQQLGLVMRLSVPAILAEISSIAMEYIDSAMVGSLGANATAAIGLVASTTWLFGGMCMASAAGFSIQIAQFIGAGQQEKARSVVRQGLVTALLIGLVLGSLGAAISGSVPHWLHGEPDVCPAASRYFLIYTCALPFLILRQSAGSMLQCSGDMRTPSILNILLCVLDVIFNFFLIFPSRTMTVFGMAVLVPGAGLGVAGAALGTALSEVAVALLMVWFLCFRSPDLRVAKGDSWRLESGCIRTAARLALPMALERVVSGGAYIAGTRIVAPLGTVAVAANSLAVTAEGFCYMPGYGIGSAATTLVGQSTGAGRPDLCKRFAYLTTAMGMIFMTLTGGLMFLISPWMFSLLTPDLAIRKLGVQVLRIEAFAEPLYGASIVATGAMRGAGDTVAPSVLTLVSMWGVRITLMMVLAPRYGLAGAWFTTCFELCVRGVLFLVRLLRGKWLNKQVVLADTGV